MELQSNSYIICPHVAGQANFTFNQRHHQHDKSVNQYIRQRDGGKRLQAWAE